MVSAYSPNTTAVLLKQTNKYWYYVQNSHKARILKSKLWHAIDTGRITVTECPRMRKKQRKSRTLDLHGIKHAAAEEKVRNFLNFVELPCTIITGDSVKMREIACSVIKEYGWHYYYRASNYGEMLILEEKI